MIHAGKNVVSSEAFPVDIRGLDDGRWRATILRSRLTSMRSAGPATSRCPSCHAVRHGASQTMAHHKR